MKKIIILSVLIFCFSFFGCKNASAEISGSTCKVGQMGGPQTSCNHNSDTAILSGQCKDQYGASNCASMPAYLNALKSDCQKTGDTSGVDCNMISQNGFYGREASAYANYKSAQKSSCDTTKNYLDYEGNCVPYSEPSYESGGVNSGIGTTSPGTGNTNPNLDCSSGVCFPTNTSLPSAGVATIISNVLYWLLGIFGFLAIIAFVISGIQYILSAGSEKGVDTAKRNMKWAMVGVVVALSGLVIIYAIDKALRATSLF
jgi:hypothetical protein